MKPAAYCCCLSTCSWIDPSLQNRTDVVTVTTRDLAAPRHLGIDGAAHPDGSYFNDPSVYEEKH